MPWWKPTLRKDVREAAILSCLGEAMPLLFDLDRFLPKLLVALKKLQGFNLYSLYLLDEGNGRLTRRCCLGKGADQLPPAVAPGEGTAGCAAETRKTLLVQGAGTPPGFWEQAVPLLSEDRLLGVLLIRNEEIILPRETGFLQRAAGHLAGSIRLAQKYAAARRAAFEDELTDLPNYRYFYQRLHEEIARAKRYGRPLTVVVIDVDELKPINDRFGHLAGDAALKETARALKESVRATDMVARYGGDEFTIIMPETGKQAAESVMERVKRICDLNYRQGELDFPLPGRSYGLASYPEDGEDAVDLFAAADRRLYSTKERKLASGALNSPPRSGPGTSNADRLPPSGD
ncbi:MAG: sensor domain-containing diguanylate cyclase [Firmicutes bacterium]|nr:sensor domain-containing diguanylate cyclase [Bacillota bacterium]